MYIPQDGVQGGSGEGPGRVGRGSRGGRERVNQGQSGTILDDRELKPIDNTYDVTNELPTRAHLHPGSLGDIQTRAV